MTLFVTVPLPANLSTNLLTKVYASFLRFVIVGKGKDSFIYSKKVTLYKTVNKAILGKGNPN